jgi:hypothetical protein
MQNLGPVAQVSVARNRRSIDAVPFYTAYRVRITCGTLYHKMSCAEAIVDHRIETPSFVNLGQVAYIAGTMFGRRNC